MEGDAGLEGVDVGLEQPVEGDAGLEVDAGLEQPVEGDAGPEGDADSEDQPEESTDLEEPSELTPTEDLQYELEPLPETEFGPPVKVTVPRGYKGNIGWFALDRWLMRHARYSRAIYMPGGDKEEDSEDDESAEDKEATAAKH